MSKSTKTLSDGAALVAHRWRKRTPEERSAHGRWLAEQRWGKRAAARKSQSGGDGPEGGAK